MEAESNVEAADHCVPTDRINASAGNFQCNEAQVFIKVISARKYETETDEQCNKGVILKLRAVALLHIVKIAVLMIAMIASAIRYN